MNPCLERMRCSMISRAQVRIPNAATMAIIPVPRRASVQLLDNPVVIWRDLPYFHRFVVWSPEDNVELPDRVVPFVPPKRDWRGRRGKMGLMPLRGGKWAEAQPCSSLVSLGVDWG